MGDGGDSVDGLRICGRADRTRADQQTVEWEMDHEGRFRGA